MSTVKTNNVQIGQSVTATNNFTWYQPSTPDGTVRLGNGNSGSVTDLVTLTSAGNLGIGTSSPGSKLTVALTRGAFDFSGAAPGIAPKIIANNGYGAYLVFGETSATSWSLGKINGTDALSFLSSDALTGGTERMRLDSSGNLGLGVTPSAWATYKALQIGPNLAAGFIAGAGNDTYFGDSAYYNAGWKYAYTGVSVSAYRQTAGQHIWYTAPSGTSGNAISFTQAMTLDASGNLCIATNGGSQKLYVNGGIRVVGTGNLSVAGDPGLISYEYPATRCYVGDSTGYSWRFTKRSSSTNTDLLTISDTGTSVVIGQLAGSGSRTVTADASGGLGASSDSSLKQEDKTAILPGLAEILRITPKAYKWLSDIEVRGDDAATEIGFFADQVAPIIPSAAPLGADGLYGFYDRSVLAALVNAAKELTTRLEALENK